MLSELSQRTAIVIYLLTKFLARLGMLEKRMILGLKTEMQS